jgi:caffeoyl-CoA O-methyltransferase
MDLTLDHIAAYLRNFVCHPHPVLAHLEADAAARGVPIVGPWEAQLLSLLARSIRARRILELGTATGYSAIWLAIAVAEWDGHVTTVDQDPIRVREAQQNIDAANLSDRIHIVPSTALPALQTLSGPFDLIFNDILSYLASPDEAQQLLNACLRHLRPGGLLLCDNALRGGRVLDATTDTGVSATKLFTETLLQHPHVDTSLIAIRDGLLVCRKHDGQDGCASYAMA